MKKKAFVISVLILFCIFFMGKNTYAAPTTIPIPNVNVSVDNAATPSDYVDNIKLLVMLTILTLLPSIIIMTTSFTRIVVVLGFLKNALGTQNAPPNQVIIGLALFLTFFIMMPTYTTINNNAIQPYLNNRINQQQAITEGERPLKEFMLKQTRRKDLQLFMDAAKMDPKTDTEHTPMHVVIPAFIISELKTAFIIGFLLFIPFMIIDFVVASILMSMGMFMVPPAMVSLPFKILLFVMVDGWYLVVKSLISSFS
ncbi:flagellar biosynthetic protein FliP [Clostridium pasteurianum DSM 525 = ATCC 6013]|uniref:Flagellar biosynthetic protein FliP n=1 Tax=Clostridium pasteurianum DSM 525 = ATCC 6013 TaxID=1262449 RepID=A0A0H3J4L3_CLOPA|nr:flagellar type III secretion system pore protein FliP [Clostridium pasteurianum]AJA47897.1 flagellar biosynthetic protein FliP [Clostridium pasteurianum DSM 525 = ATCC 6013]AJA51885.1 flagellar biosynthetic protein FliP [Clostridium pasteurianum DSM 525 = ATCC 6013]AOZ75187.1 flagellar biosynthesis protein flip [Clostridium pasteurianum DSM 525 = ATCC 6013]AOZ78982.1 flagellar biosynthesis protein flip [Clostridium pasteurianum]ELP59800.1 flagellar biosynthesis protein FliP [Clostridium pas